MAIAVYLVVIFIIQVQVARGARILGVFPMWARSHHRFLQPVMKTLAAAGHDVVMYSPFPLDPPHPNYTDVFLKNIDPDSERLKEYFLELTAFPEWKCLDAHSLLYLSMYKDFIEDPQIVQLILKKDKFDLIFTEAFTIQEHVLLLGHVLKAPVISLQSFFLNNLANSHSGNGLSLSYVPDVCTSLSNKMNFFERMFNSFSSLRGLLFYYNTNLPTLQKVMREKFPDLPPITELAKTISLHFVNDHPTADYAQPRPPNVVSVAGIHIEPTQPLPEKLQKFMDEATDGVIFFSLGTYVQDELKHKEYFDMFISVLKKVKQRVIWKTRKENIEGLPSNILTLRWAPQAEILAHHNCVLFITHGGLLSQHEAIYFGVPVVGIPQFYDQRRNMRYYEEQGVGINVAPDDMSEDRMTLAIRNVLHNPSYRENMKRLSAIFRDRPMSPADTVVFWTEYVLRHGGAAHLRPASTEILWYQLIFLDVIALIIVTVILFLSFLLIILKTICKY